MVSAVYKIDFIIVIVPPLTYFAAQWFPGGMGGFAI